MTHKKLFTDKTDLKAKFRLLGHYKSSNLHKVQEWLAKAK